MYVYMYVGVYIPYEWYIWRTLSLAIWEVKQIDGHKFGDLGSKTD